LRLVPPSACRITSCGSSARAALPISQHTDFARVHAYEPIFDEEQDFELNIRTSGGAGLLFKADGSGLEAAANIGGLTVGTPPALALPNSQRKQLKVRTPSGGLVDAWSAIVAYEKTIPPISPLSKSTDPEIRRGATSSQPTTANPATAGQSGPSP
jgi:hypothetical protein